MKTIFKVIALLVLIGAAFCAGNYVTEKDLIPKYNKVVRSNDRLMLEAATQRDQIAELKTAKEQAQIALIDLRQKWESIQEGVHDLKANERQMAEELRAQITYSTSLKKGLDDALTAIRKRDAYIAEQKAYIRALYADDAAAKQALGQAQYSAMEAWQTQYRRQNQTQSFQVQSANGGNSEVIYVTPTN